MDGSSYKYVYISGLWNLARQRTAELGDLCLQIYSKALSPALQLCFQPLAMLALLHELLYTNIYIYIYTYIYIYIYGLNNKNEHK